MALPAAKRFEAIALQSSQKAYAFHDAVFQVNDRLGGASGEGLLDDIAKKIGANMSKMKKDMEGDVVAKHIQDDQAEAQQFGFTGTPGFIINGVSLRGAMPFPAFKEAIEKTLARAGH